MSAIGYFVQPNAGGTPPTPPEEDFRPRYLRPPVVRQRTLAAPAPDAAVTQVAQVVQRTRPTIGLASPAQQAGMPPNDVAFQQALQDRAPDAVPNAVDQLPHEGLATIQWVSETTCISRSKIYEMINPKHKRYNPSFPKPVKLQGVDATRFVKGEIFAWIKMHMEAR